MRDGTAPVPDASAQRQALRAEATYFGCWPLVEAIDAAEERHARMEVRMTRGDGRQLLHAPV